MAKLALGHRGEASEPDFFRGVLGELVLTFLFVFIGVGAAMTAGTLANICVRACVYLVITSLASDLFTSTLALLYYYYYYYTASTYI
jgi:type III secretory pathway component EscU